MNKLWPISATVLAGLAIVGLIVAAEVEYELCPGGAVASLARILGLVSLGILTAAVGMAAVVAAVWLRHELSKPRGQRRMRRAVLVFILVGWVAWGLLVLGAGAITGRARLPPAWLESTLGGLVMAFFVLLYLGSPVVILTVILVLWARDLIRFVERRAERRSGIERFS